MTGQMHTLIGLKCFCPPSLPPSLPYPLPSPLSCPLSDHITCNFLPPSVKPGLDRACHSLLWSPDCHMALDDPLWKELDQFVAPEIKVLLVPGFMCIRERMR